MPTTTKKNSHLNLSSKLTTVAADSVVFCYWDLTAVRLFLLRARARARETKIKMKPLSVLWILSSSMLMLVALLHMSEAILAEEKLIKSAVFLSPAFVLGPGSVGNKFYYNIKFPKGHIALKEFNAEVVDEEGNSIPLHETYLHHWLVVRYYTKISLERSPDQFLHLSKHIIAGNAGICQNNVLPQHFGLGSETRQTLTYVPDPYGIEVGNPKDVPDGYEEQWMLNVHAIDTRGAVDRMGCTECRHDLYNVTVDEYGRPLGSDYVGGLYCCYDQTQCRVRDGFEGVRRKLYLKYTVKWVDWDESIVPVRIYIFDVTDSGRRTNSSTENARLGCQIEYEVESCTKEAMANGNCIANKQTKVVLRRGGDLIYGVAHQHSGGIGASLYGQDGRVICSSIPIYGKGNDAGDEAGYIVGMSTCYPEPGSIKLADKEILTFESNYSSDQMHTGVMGLFYILVADSEPGPLIQFTSSQPHLQKDAFPKFTWALVFIGVAAMLVTGVGYLGRKEREEGYQSIIM